MRPFPVLIVLVLSAAPASAQPAVLACGMHDDIVKMLTGKYHETLRHAATVKQVTLLEVFRSKAGTWTMLASQPDGRTCIVGAGDDWRDVPQGIDGVPL